MSEIIGIQIIGFLFGTFMLYFTYLHFKRKEFNKNEGTLWMVAWIFFLILTIFPNIIDFFIKDVIKFDRRLDFFIIIGFFIVVSITYHNYVTITKMKKRMEEVVRKLAIDKKIKK